jgi:hypothetical protein
MRSNRLWVRLLRERSCTALLALPLLLTGGLLTAQQRTAFTFHIYVDPIYGDDVLAFAHNPDSSGAAGKPLQAHPAGPQNISGYLQHAPYAFHTVGAALAWVNSFPVVGGNPNRHLPWPNPETGRTMEYVVIHCLPGMYGPKFVPTGPDEYDPRSGRPWNGEHFPLEIPGRVCIQGTSALDTIFDARAWEPNAPSGLMGNIFQMGDGYLDHPQEWFYTFIDSVTIRGARGGSYQGAGILIKDETPVRATISNCFIYNNVVGIGLRHDDPDATTGHKPYIINNTIAWNEVGLWNGSTQVIVGGFSQGVNYPILVNNIFDSSTPPMTTANAFATAMVGNSGFEGVHQDDLTVASKGGCVPAGGLYNAYEWNTPIPRVNTGQAFAWVKTQPRLGGVATAPLVSITPWTRPPNAYGTRSMTRGALYVNDVFRLNVATMPSQHDFRLAPMVDDTANLMANPLVNVGIDNVTSPGLITMANVQAPIVPERWPLCVLGGDGNPHARSTNHPDERHRGWRRRRRPRPGLRGQQPCGQRSPFPE